ncbi:MAG TPA: BON domain-containing protein [Casimicrobiaceae bacterium]|jgi:hyperosmotically inducible periplasmic protein|nr:BON domain-containing protein [Casimicrobiaceae bacterium]
MRKSHVAIACLLAAGLMAPGAASAWGDKAKTQAANTTNSTTTNTSSSAHEAMSDAAITTKVKAEFAKEKNVSATHIKVDTDNGVVKLSGTARSQQEADRAAQLARDTKGVTSVENDIQVVAGAK